MLRSKDGLSSGRVSRAVLTAMLLFGVVAVSAVRSPAQKSDNNDVKSSPADMSVSVTPAFPSVLGHHQAYAPADTKLKVTTREPFNFSPYLPGDTQGVLVLRPGAIFAQPGMNKYAAMLKLDAEELKQIDCIMLSFSREGFTEDYKESNDKQRDNPLITRLIIRTVEDIDWLKQIKEAVPSLKEIHDGDHTYYCIPKGTCKSLWEGDGLNEEIPFIVFPDHRTILFGMKKLPPAGPRKLPAWLAADWKYVERDAVAVALDFQSFGFRDCIKQDRLKWNGYDIEMAPSLTELVVNTKSLVLGFDARDKLYFKVFTRGATKETAAKITEVSAFWLRFMKEFAKAFNEGVKKRKEENLTKEQIENAKAEIKEEEIMLDFYINFISNSRWTWVDNAVQLHSEVEMSLSDLLTALWTVGPLL